MFLLKTVRSLGFLLYIPLYAIDVNSTSFTVKSQITELLHVLYQQTQLKLSNCKRLLLLFFARVLNYISVRRFSTAS